MRGSRTGTCTRTGTGTRTRTRTRNCNCNCNCNCNRRRSSTFRNHRIRPRLASYSPRPAFSLRHNVVLLMPSAAQTASRSPPCAASAARI
jgi:hypothetical protein